MSLQLISISAHDQSPAFIQSDEPEVRANAPVSFGLRSSEQHALFRKWTILWRSIILSSFDYATYRPYCRYLRILDLRNLNSMFDDSKFTGSTRTDFFAGRLKPFYFQKPAPYGRLMTIDVLATINAVGEAVTQKASLLEELDGNLSPGFLTRWISRSPRLESLVLWNGDALSDGAGSAVKSTCASFKSLTIHDWLAPHADQKFAEFLSDLSPNSLEYFELISHSRVSGLSFAALGQHAKSLKTLILSFTGDAMENLGALKSCTSLQRLHMEDNTRTSLLTFHQDVFVEVAGWLSSCRELRDLSLNKFSDGAALLAEILVTAKFKLQRLSLEGYVVRANQAAAAFHTALAEQDCLESIMLKGNGEDADPDDLSIMVQSLCRLSNLRELVLKDVSDEFEEDHIISLAMSLPLLEEFWSSGLYMSRNILLAFTNLEYLKSLTLNALTQFEAGDIVEFLAHLDPEKQKGFNLSLMAADPQYDLTEDEQEMIRDLIRSRFDGRFEFVLWREAETSESEED